MDINGIATAIVGPFGALVLSAVVLYFLYRLHVRVLDMNERAWENVGTLSAALRENNALTREALGMAHNRGRG